MKIRLLEQLLKVCQEVRVTVTIPKNENPYLYQGPYHLFSLSKEMTTKLLAICREEDYGERPGMDGWSGSVPVP